METGIIRIARRLDLYENSNLPYSGQMFKTVFDEIMHEMGFGRFQNWKALSKHDPQKAKEITAEVNKTIEGHFRVEDWPMLGSLTDIISKSDISCPHFKTKIQDCTFNDASTLKLTLYLTTDELLYLGSVSDKIICAKMDQFAELKEGKEIETFMLQIDETLAISHYKAKQIISVDTAMDT